MARYGPQVGPDITFLGVDRCDHTDPPSMAGAAGHALLDDGVGTGALIMVQEKRAPAPSVAVPGPPPSAPAGFVPDHKRPSFIPPPPPMPPGAAGDAPPPPPPEDDAKARSASTVSDSISLVLSNAPEQPLAKWSAAAVLKWIKANDLAPPFVQWMEASPANAVDGALLGEMDDHMLTDAGVRNKIHRVKLLQAIAALKERDRK